MHAKSLGNYASKRRREWFLVAALVAPGPATPIKRPAEPSNGTLVKLDP